MTDLDQCPDFLWEAIPSSPTPEHPFITLTYAQSLDAKIAGKGRKQVKLSGEESMTMTHW
jgi:2,5-diamino-6-(ribosylamino)-4(3H)-pyrimidinone 5'-phosphate reductase